MLAGFPNGVNPKPRTLPGSGFSTMGTWYLCYFLHRLLDFRIPEVESLAKLFGFVEDTKICNGYGNIGHSNDDVNGDSVCVRRLLWKQAPNHHPDCPFFFVYLPSEDAARKIAQRSLLIKGMFEIWGQGTSAEELRSAIENYPSERKLPYLREDSTFKIVVDTFGKVLSSHEHGIRIDSLSYIPFKGRVKLKDPEHKFWLIETNGQVVNNGLPPAASQITFFFGRELGSGDRGLVTKYFLGRRSYLGPTAMDAEIAHLMANQAMVDKGKLIYDPFAGTGSILVAAAHYGAITMGADIDIRVIRDGRGPSCNVWSNFSQYNLPPPVGLIRGDNNSPPWRADVNEVFDAIICDPPYGIRAGGRKSGGRKMLKGVVEPYVVPEDKRKDHIPSTAQYILEECIHDLFDVAARLLVMGGRLVFFFPKARDEWSIDSYPKHPCFTLVSSSEQILSTRYSRCLLTMEKTSIYTASMLEAASKRHMEYKKNHAKLLEDRERSSMHSLVLAPQSPLDNKRSDDSRSKYRGKYV